MKLLYSVLLCILSNYLFAAPVIRATSNGRWAQASTWNLNRLPQNGDTVIIPLDIEVTLDFNESLNNLAVKITGTLKLNNGKLNLNAASRIDIAAQGRLSGNGNNDQVKIGGELKFRGGVDQSILGPAYSDTSTGPSPNGFTGGFSMLRATLTDFAVNKVNNEVHVSWVSVPGNTLRFDIEKSSTGNSWSMVEAIDVSGDPGLPQQYLYIDKNPGTYYRVKQVFAASVAYTAVKAAIVINKTSINIYSTPEMVKVRFDGPVKFPVTVTVTDENGRLVKKAIYRQALIDLRLHGTFVVHVKDAGGIEKASVVIL